MAGPEYVRVGGLPYQTSPDHVPDIASQGGKVISEGEARTSAKAQSDLSYVDQNWGAAGKLGMGAVSGLSLGLAPGLLAAGGLVDPGHLQAAQTSGLYTAGDVGGMVLPTLLTGGEGLLARGAAMTPAGLMGLAGNATERLAMGVLGDSAGLMGRAISTPLKMAARGAAEGALINMGQTMGDNLIQNKPFAAEALAALGDGALYGGLFGAGLGTVGALGSIAVDSANNFLSKGVGAGKEKAAKGLLTRALGEDAAKLDSYRGPTVEEGPAEGGFRGAIRAREEVLNLGGASIEDTTYKKFKASEAAQPKLIALKTEAVDELDQVTGHIFVPNLERLDGRFRETVVAPKAGTPLHEFAGKEVDSLIDSMKGGKAYTKAVSEEGIHIPGEAPPKPKFGEPYKKGIPEINRPGTELPGFSEHDSLTFKKLVEVRDQLAAEIKATNPVSDTLAPTKNTVKREILNALDDEIRMAMEDAGNKSPGLGKVVDKYTSAQGLLKVASEMEESLGAKYSKELNSSGSILTPKDIGGAATMALWHPAAAVGWLAAKKLAPKIQARVEPGMIRAAYAQQIGIQAATAASQVKSKIGESLSKFFKTSTQTPTKYAQKDHAKDYGKKDLRKAYEDRASRTEQLLSENHQDNVRRYAEGLHNKGYGALGNAVMSTYQRAYEYALWNQQSRQGTKGLGSLRKMPVPKVPTLMEYKSMRIDKGIYGPLSVLEDLENGSISRDQVAAMKYVYPEIHNEMVSQAAQQIYEMKAEGKHLPMDKIASLGVLLDAPIDSTLTPEYVGAVQVALAAPPPGQEPPPQPQPGPGMINPQNFMTPLQSTQMAMA